MRDGAWKACVAMICITALYAMYVLTHREADGILFASTAAVVAGLAGYTAGVLRREIKE